MKVNYTCEYNYECTKHCVVYKITIDCCGNFYVVNTQNTLKRMEQHFQYVAQKVMHNKNLDSSADHFVKHFTAQNNVVRLCLSK